MLLAERVVNLVLKLNVRANFARAARRTVHFHDPTILVIGISRDSASGGFFATTEEVVLDPSFEIERLRCVLRRVSRHRSEGRAHFAHDRFGVGDVVSLREPTRFVIREPSCAGRIFPDERLQWQIDSNCLHRLHQRRAAAGITENDELSRS